MNSILSADFYVSLPLAYPFFACPKKGYPQKKAPVHGKDADGFSRRITKLALAGLNMVIRKPRLNPLPDAVQWDLKTKKKDFIIEYLKNFLSPCGRGSG